MSEDQRGTVGLEMLASRILTPSFGCWPARFFASASESRDALAHVSEGEKKTKGLDRNRVRLVPPPDPPCPAGRDDPAELCDRQPDGGGGGPPAAVRLLLPHRAPDQPPWPVHRVEQHQGS